MLPWKEEETGNKKEYRKDDEAGFGRQDVRRVQEHVGRVSNRLHREMYCYMEKNVSQKEDGDGSGGVAMK